MTVSPPVRTTPAPQFDDAIYPEEVLRSAWNPDIEQAGRLHLPARGGAEHWPGVPPVAWVEGLLEEIASL